jgi:hypothetical protein
MLTAECLGHYHPQCAPLEMASRHMVILADSDVPILMQSSSQWLIEQAALTYELQY